MAPSHFDEGWRAGVQKCCTERDNKKKAEKAAKYKAAQAKVEKDMKAVAAARQREAAAKKEIRRREVSAKAKLEKDRKVAAEKKAKYNKAKEAEKKKRSAEASRKKAEKKAKYQAAKAKEAADKKKYEAATKATRKRASRYIERRAKIFAAFKASQKNTRGSINGFRINGKCHCDGKTWFANINAGKKPNCFCPLRGTKPI